MCCMVYISSKQRQQGDLEPLLVDCAAVLPGPGSLDQVFGCPGKPPPAHSKSTGPWNEHARIVSHLPILPQRDSMPEHLARVAWHHLWTRQQAYIYYLTCHPCKAHRQLHSASAWLHPTMNATRVLTVQTCEVLYLTFPTGRSIHTYQF